MENSYSFIMRRLRKENPDKAIAFQIAFKNAFDDAFLNNLENLDKIALLQAMKEVKYPFQMINHLEWAW